MRHIVKAEKGEGLAKWYTIKKRNERVGNALKTKNPIQKMDEVLCKTFIRLS
jgi:hypothetical protein